MKKIFLILLLVFSSCKKSYIVEKKLQDCYFSSFSDNGVKAKAYLKEFESILIKNSILKNSSEEEYYNLFLKTFKGKSINVFTNYSLSDSLGKISDNNFMRYSFDCVNNIKNEEFFKNSVTYKIRNLMISKSDFFKTPTDSIMYIYPKDYFKLDLHKLELLILLDLDTQKN